MSWKYGQLMTASQFVSYVRKQSSSRLTSTHVHGTWAPRKSDFNGKNHRRLQDGMRRYHMHTRGWSDIAQHATIFPDGKVMTGRNINRAPASAYHHNDLDRDGVHPFMIEMIGNFDIGHERLEGPQLQAAIELVQHITHGHFYFHREMQSGKTCPGSGISRSWFESKVRGVRKKASSPFDDYRPDQLKGAPNGAEFSRTLSYIHGRQMIGDDILAVQKRLGVKPIKNRMGKEYGIYGPITEKAVYAFQKKQGAKHPSGKVGDWTWAKLFGLNQAH
ncbi:peptidoglycan recognition protein family protein [Marininema halotolerans]|uniref:Putative peptidoglycan binding domain-containing protein n=1 Tax=Marininema halotolerans TaxID=1155944 RepID=A0A1I6SGJ2_9BACL|nr:N-acetylmuramoyl-L-alanine amidase [Marininema halotolerans]SFS76034.1 Putative peptidoglycan binding domain-containing protein [Marininema halotolerans]